MKTEYEVLEAWKRSDEKYREFLESEKERGKITRGNDTDRTLCRVTRGERKMLIDNNPGAGFRKTI